VPEAIAESRPTRVTFFEDRAEVTRLAEVSVSDGRQWLRVGGMTPLLDDRSVQARVVGDKAKVLAARVTRRTRQISDLKPERGDELRKVIAEAAHRYGWRQNDMHRLSQRAGYVRELIDGWVDGLTAPRALLDTPPAAWAEVWQMLMARDIELFERELECQDELDDAHEQQHLATMQLSSESTMRALFECFVEVQVESVSANDIELEVKYRTPCALWRPEHLARLHRDAKQPATGEMEWTTWGVVWQRTGEDWADVDVAFSTARPAQIATAPLLSDDVLQKRKKTAEEKKQVVVQMREQAISDAGGGSGEMPGVDDGGKPLEFSPKGKVTLPSNGQPRRVEISRRDVKAAVVRVLMPERAQTAFLRADASWPGDAPILAGPLHLARGGALVGRTLAKFVAPGEKFETGFGPEEGVRSKRGVREERETAKLTGSQTITRVVTLHLSNLGDEPREMTILERIPVSEIEGLEVKLTDAKEWKLDKDGYLTRQVSIKPRANDVFAFSYEIKAKSNVVLPF
jgi:uncharacterized protein (TIGR02231 family)